MQVGRRRTREILFRGKSKETGKWVFGSFLQNPSTGQSIIASCNTNNAGIYDFVTVDPTTVGQFTGLCDKHGKKIFEHDIMEFEAYGIHYIGIVTIENGNSGIHCIGKADPFLDDAIKRHGTVLIGNIHDNPELLEE